MPDVTKRNSAPGRSTRKCLRTCVGCRQRDRQSDLLRVVAKGSAVIPDGNQRQAGRGGYLHYDQRCFDAANQRQAFSRALRLGGSVSVEAVARVLQQGQKTDGSQSGDEMSSQ
jgi:predicted RNA-binding protein YlxR (DUF448 family)